jgi:hypothetical protein
MAEDDSTARAPEEVLRDHLRRRQRGDLEGDLAANYAADVIVLSKDGAYRGHDGIRQTAAILRDLLPNAEFGYDLMRVEDGVALLGWSATVDGRTRVRGGADSFLIRDGRIAAQTIHYAVEDD